MFISDTSRGTLNDGFLPLSHMRCSSNETGAYIWIFTNSKHLKQTRETCVVEPNIFRLCVQNYIRVSHQHEENSR